MSDSTPETLFESHLELVAKIGSNFPLANAFIDECAQEALNKGFTLYFTTAGYVDKLAQLITLVRQRGLT